MGKRGSITIFIILGILLLLGTSVILYSANVKKSLATLPKDKDLKKITEFTNDCILTLGEEAIRLVGLQGGYIYIPRQIKQTETSYIKLANQIFLPYWYYEGKDRAPKQEIVQAHINRYIEENLNSCLQNFSSFKQQYKFKKLSEPQIKTEISQDDVAINLNMPMKINAVGKELSTGNFRVEIPVKLGRMLKLSRSIMDFENKNQWFENVTFDLMSMDPKIPLNNIELKCKDLKWKLTDIQKQLQKDLQVNLPSIRVKNTDTAPFNSDESVYKKILRNYAFEDIVKGNYPKDVPSDMYEYAKMQLDVGNKKSNLVVNFNYEPNFGMDINGFPNDNGILSSRKVNGAAKYLSYMCINIYHFVYDVIYPVKGTIVDSDAFNNRGFVFQFAFPVLIDNNRPNRQYFGYRQFVGFEQAPDFCEKLNGPEAQLSVRGDFPGYGYGDIPDVDLIYQCIGQVCNLGKTKAENGRYVLNTKLPEGCSNPLITAKKDGYLQQTKQLTRDSLQFDLTALYDLDLSVEEVKYDTDYKPLISEIDTTSTKTLGRGENLTLAISYLGNERFDQTLIFPRDNKIQLVDAKANYSIRAVLTLFGKVTGGYNNENVQLNPEDFRGRSKMILKVIKAVPTTFTDKYTQEVSILMLDKELKDKLEVTFK